MRHFLAGLQGALSFSPPSPPSPHPPHLSHSPQATASAPAPHPPAPPPPGPPGPKHHDRALPTGAKINSVWCPRRPAPSFLLVLLFLLTPLLQAGCSDPETFFELGPRFAFESPPPGKARIYCYWPASSPAFRGVYQIAAPVLLAV